jgi:hypothetical protein
MVNYMGKILEKEMVKMASLKEIYSNKYKESCNLNVSLRIRLELYKEYNLFQNIVGILVTHDRNALLNDPNKNYINLAVEGGGVGFKNSALEIGKEKIYFKTSMLNIEKQNPIYPPLISNIINELSKEFDVSKGVTIRERLIKAGLKLSPYEDDFFSLVKNFKQPINFRAWGKFYGNEIQKRLADNIITKYPATLDVQLDNKVYVFTEQTNSGINDTFSYEIEIDADIPKTELIEQLSVKYKDTHCEVKIKRQGRTNSYSLYTRNIGESTSIKVAK